MIDPVTTMEKFGEEGRGVGDNNRAMKNSEADKSL
jgi:hypothetical protein